MQTTYGTPLEIGAAVYGSDGEKIGEISEIQNEYFVIEKGLIFTTDLYIPISAVRSRDGDGVRLSMTKPEVENSDLMNAPPLSDQDSAGPVGYAGQHTDGRSAGPGAQAVTDLDTNDETTRP